MFSLFHRKFENGPFLAKNGPKSAFLAQNAQKWRVFSIFFQKLRVGISLFFAGSLVSAVQKILLLWFSIEIWKWPLFGQKGPKSPKTPKNGGF